MSERPPLGGLPEHQNVTKLDWYSSILKCNSISGASIPLVAYAKVLASWG